jgi:hypothetical protein
MSVNHIYYTWLLSKLYLGPSDAELQTFLTGLSYQNSGKGLSFDDQLIALQRRFGLEIGYVRLVICFLFSAYHRSGRPCSSGQGSV